MSYILDALRRSEQERARGGTPDVTTQHEPAREAPAPARPSSRALWLVAGAMALNGIVLGLWLLRPGAGADAPERAAPPAAGAPEGAPPGPAAAARSAAPGPGLPRPGRTPGPPARAPVTPPPTMAAPRPAAETGTRAPSPPAGAPPGEARAGRRPEDATAETVTAAAAGADARAAPARPAPVAIRDLPDRIQRRIPSLAFATHIYADEPRYREVTINGRRYAEGARVEGMLLSEITETGVVFDYEGHRFEVGVLEDWDY